MNSAFLNDYLRMTEDSGFRIRRFLREYIFQHRMRYMFYLRKAQAPAPRLLHLYYEFRLFILCRKYGIEIKSSTDLGDGFVMVHPYNITISTTAHIGKNVTMLKGSTIGQALGGAHPGAPTVGERVFLGINSSIIGGITVGDDVLIAPNTLVNCDVPSHSIVVGSPCAVIPKENATADYIK